MGLAASSSPKPECGGTSTPLPPATSGLFEQLVEQPAMAFLLLFVLQQAGLLKIELILEGELAVFARRPDDPSDGGQGGNHPIEKLAIELARGHVLPRQLRDFADQGLDLSAGLLDQIVIRRLLRNSFGHLETERCTDWIFIRVTHRGREGERKSTENRAESTSLLLGDGKGEGTPLSGQGRPPVGKVASPT